ncbi:MAG: tol-pal system protein YbgF [Rubrivivax sp.]|jgi:tol-pal system protein YbgF|nr:tol-pal system protein YbgF [Rubrivivax sp.]
MRVAPWRAAMVALVCLGGALPAARAGLFDDEEARKAIVDLRNRITAVDDQGKLRATELAALNTQLTEQLTALRRSLLDLNNQLEAMRGEIAKLRGNDEQLTRDVADIQQRQKDVGQALDDRLRKLEPVKVSIDGKEFLVEQDEKKGYEEAIAAIRTGDFDKSVNLLSNFQRRYASSPYTDSARFWLGNALYGKRDYKEAINAFRNFVTGAPEHARAAEALLALANSQAEMKDGKGARKTIEELIKAYPDSEAAQAGKERLASIK